MGVQAVQRINPQNLAAVQVSLADSDKIANLLAKLSARGYETESVTGAKWSDQGGWRIAFKRADYPDQFAYPGDWILVTDATYDGDGGWTLAASSTVVVYGISTGLAGTADDFTNTFAPVAE